MSSMNQNKFERGMVGEPQTFGDFTIQPTARLSGRSWESSDGIGGGAMVRIIPTEVVVSDGEGVETVIEIKDDQRNALLGMLLGALALAAFCVAIMAIANRRASSR